MVCTDWSADGLSFTFLQPKQEAKHSSVDRFVVGVGASRIPIEETLWSRCPAVRGKHNKQDTELQIIALNMQR